MIFFSSDHHFNHANILEYCNRDFGSTQEMNDSLVRSWNSTVSSHDTVYYMGDFCFCNYAKATEYISLLNGNILYILDKTHHDKTWASRVSYGYSGNGIKFLPSMITEKINGIFITMCHFPMHSWNKEHYGAWMLHGHTHSSYRDGGSRKILDIGVDSARRILGEYRPFSFDEVRNEIIGE